MALRAMRWGSDGQKGDVHVGVDEEVDEGYRAMLDLPVASHSSKMLKSCHDCPAILYM